MRGWCSILYSRLHEKNKQVYQLLLFFCVMFYCTGWPCCRFDGLPSENQKCLILSPLNETGEKLLVWMKKARKRLIVQAIGTGQLSKLRNNSPEKHEATRLILSRFSTGRCVMLKCSWARQLASRRQSKTTVTSCPKCWGHVSRGSRTGITDYKVKQTTCLSLFGGSSTRWKGADVFQIHLLPLSCHLRVELSSSVWRWKMRFLLHSPGKNNPEETPPCSVWSVMMLPSFGPEFSREELSDHIFISQHIHI